MKRIFTAAVFIAVMWAMALCAFAQSESRADTLKQIEVKRSELAALEKKFLAPSEEERAMYAEFLARPDTGLIRLLPRETFDRDDKVTIRGGGAYYSFALLTHAYGRGSDIELQLNRLSVGFAGFDYGLLAKAGNGPLDEVTFEHPSVRALAKYKAATTESDARLEHRRFGAGVSITRISSQAPAASARLRPLAWLRARSTVTSQTNRPPLRARSLMKLLVPHVVRSLKVARWTCWKSTRLQIRRSRMFATSLSPVSTLLRPATATKYLSLT